MVTATVVGLLTGLFIVATRINCIVMLGTMTIRLGAQYRLAGTRTVDGYSETLKGHGVAAPLNIPPVFLAALASATARGSARPDHGGRRPFGEEEVLVRVMAAGGAVVRQPGLANVLARVDEGAGEYVPDDLALHPYTPRSVPRRRPGG